MQRVNSGLLRKDHSAGANLAMFDLTLNWISNLKAVSDLNWKNVARPTTENT